MRGGRPRRHRKNTIIECGTRRAAGLEAVKCGNATAAAQRGREGRARVRGRLRRARRPEARRGEAPWSSCNCIRRHRFLLAMRPCSVPTSLAAEPRAGVMPALDGDVPLRFPVAQKCPGHQGRHVMRPLIQRPMPRRLSATPQLQQRQQGHWPRDPRATRRPKVAVPDEGASRSDGLEGM